MAQVTRVEHSFVATAVIVFDHYLDVYPQVCVIDTNAAPPVCIDPSTYTVQFNTKTRVTVTLLAPATGDLICSV